MPHTSFPFSAIIGQDSAKLGLLCSIVDPKIGGVLISGVQGTGKTTLIRSIQRILPKITVRQDCQFQCFVSKDVDGRDPIHYQCAHCKEKSTSALKISRPIPFVNLPLGIDVDMLVGSMDLEKMLKTGKMILSPGLFAKAHRGILYIDEINLLQDHIVDLLLDVASSRLNRIERDGFSLHHPSDFVLIGSMNPEEGELRPQIQARFGIELNIAHIRDPPKRAQITQRIYEFQSNSDTFLDEFHTYDRQIQKKLIRARETFESIPIPPEFYIKASQLSHALGINSSRAEIAFLRSSRVIACLNDHHHIEESDLQTALSLVFSAKLVRIYGKSMNPNYLTETFLEIWHKIPSFLKSESETSDTENPLSFKETFRTTSQIGKAYVENKIPQFPECLEEIENHSSDREHTQDRYTSYDLDQSQTPGYKAGDKIETQIQQKTMNQIPFYLVDSPIQMDVSSIFSHNKKWRKIVSYTGKGSRIKVISQSGGRYIYARSPRSKIPRSIAFDASIKSHYTNYPYSLRRIQNHVFPKMGSDSSSLAIQLNLEDLKEKINELRAPLSLYFIVDASASMRRSLPLTIKIIQSVHAEGYKKKDKVSVISFQGRSVELLQRPSVSLTVALNKLRDLQATSYTPLASALKRTLTLINQESIKGFAIPIIIVISDLGANISLNNPNLNASTRQDFDEIADELSQMARKIGKMGYLTIIMKPLKSFATRYLGVDYHSVQKIEKSFQMLANSQIFEYDTLDVEGTIMNLQKIVKDYSV